MHYNRVRKTGSVDDPRPHLKARGRKFDHALWKRWLVLQRRKVICDRWQDFWTFVDDVGDPGESRKLARLRQEELYGPDNFRWTVPMIGEAKLAYHRAYTVVNIDRARDLRFRKKYGIGLAAYEALYRRQNGRCAICGQKEVRAASGVKRPRNLALDHDHLTGRVRGLLCGDCNTGLGLIGDQNIGDASLYLMENRRLHKYEHCVDNPHEEGEMTVEQVLTANP